jgi:hypothetical protein
MDYRPVLYRNSAEFSFSERDLESCLESIKLRNVLFFLYGDNIIFDKELKEEVDKCNIDEWFSFKKEEKHIKTLSKRKRKRGKNRKIILSKKPPAPDKEGIKIFFDNTVLYAYEA